MFYHFLITCVPFTTIVVGRFGHFAPAIWLYAGHTLLIAAVGLRLVPSRRIWSRATICGSRQLSAMLLMVSSLLAIALSFVQRADRAVGAGA